MKPKTRLESLQLRLRNARKRARYWSGNPSPTGFGYQPSTSSAKADIEYEMAVDDCEAIADEIEVLTGHRPSVPKPKEEFNESFSRTVLPSITRK
jgi:hypothetical protein